MAQLQGFALNSEHPIYVFWHDVIRQVYDPNDHTQYFSHLNVSFHFQSIQFLLYTLEF